MTLPLPPNQTPRGWQLEALAAIRSGLAQWPRVLVSAATGTGKGTLLAGVCAIAAGRRKRVLVIAHREELITDLRTRIESTGVAAGLCAMGRTEGLACSVVVASIQSLGRRFREVLQFGSFDLVIVDEAHHAIASSYQKALEKVGPRHVIGFTATPFRSAPKGATKGLGKVFDALVFEYGIADAITAGDLVPLRALQVSTTLTLDTVRTRGADFDQADLASVVDCDERNALAVQQWQEHAAGRPTLVFAATVAHAQHLAEAFVAVGIEAAPVWGDMDRSTRRDRIAAFRTGAVPVLTSCDLIFEGFDAPRTSCILKARPTKSRIVFQQMIGRGLRTAAAKADCLFIDLVDNGCELDLATVADLSLDAGARPKRAELKEGDRVRRLHHDDWGIGTVAAPPDRDAAVVQWPVSRVWPDACRRAHPIVELVRVAEDAVPLLELTISPRVVGVRTYEVMLLRPGTKAIGWYALEPNVHVAGGATGAVVGSERRVTYFIEDGDVWTIATERVEDRWHDVVELAHIASTHVGALTWAESDARAKQVRITPAQAEWKGDACTDAQRNALARWGVRRHTDGMSKGEASALLDAVIARRKVRDAQRGFRRAAG